jgi:large subunit ribosomal protein L32e
MGIKELLELRKRKPDFVRQDFHKKRLKKKWRRPRGLHSKVRLRLKGKPRIISTGFSAPKEVRGLHRSGLKPVLVNSLKDIKRIKKETEGAIIGSSIGLKKKCEIIKKLRELQIEILNIKDAEEYLKKADEKLSSRKERRKKLKEGKEKKKEKPKKEEKLTEKLTEEEKKEAEKKEKDKILTKKV